LLAHALHSQIDMHQAYGGVVPELASRDHIRRVLPLAQHVLEAADRSLAQVDVVAYTRGPGLGRAPCWSGRRGLCPGRGAGQAGDRCAPPGGASVVAVPECRPAEFPFVALLVSGGHTQLMRVDGSGSYALLGETIDDAAGEAFDKSAKLMGLPYPGGPAWRAWLKVATRRAFKLPRPLLHSGNLDFSFAGLKTAVMVQARKLQSAAQARRASNPPVLRAAGCNPQADLAASTEAAIVEVLVRKSLAAVRPNRPVAGWSWPVGWAPIAVARGSSMPVCAQRGIRVHYPELHLCTDNGAMIALAAPCACRRARPKPTGTTPSTSSRAGRTRDPAAVAGSVRVDQLIDLADRYQLGQLQRQHAVLQLGLAAGHVEVGRQLVGRACSCAGRPALDRCARHCPRCRCSAVRG
jgi:N6-L-threonylcarbamoyladenine synthase